MDPGWVNNLQYREIEKVYSCLQGLSLEACVMKPAFVGYYGIVQATVPAVRPDIYNYQIDVSFSCVCPVIEDEYFQSSLLTHTAIASWIHSYLDNVDEIYDQ